MNIAHWITKGTLLQATSLYKNCWGKVADHMLDIVRPPTPFPMHGMAYHIMYTVSPPDPAPVLALFLAFP